MASKGNRMIQQMKTELITAFLMMDIGLINFYLEIKVECNREKRTIKLSQPAYISKILSKFYLNKAHP